VPAPRGTDRFRRLDGRTVLFAYDGSEAAKASILQAAHRLGPDRRAIVLTVWHAPESPNHVAEVATKVAYEGARLARSVGFDARPIAASGDSVELAIVEYADAHDASIVVLASAGSASAAVARHTKHTVLTIGAPSAAAA